MKQSNNIDWATTIGGATSYTNQYNAQDAGLARATGAYARHNAASATAVEVHPQSFTAGDKWPGLVLVCQNDPTQDPAACVFTMRKYTDGVRVSKIARLSGNSSLFSISGNNVRVNCGAWSTVTAIVPTTVNFIMWEFQ